MSEECLNNKITGGDDKGLTTLMMAVCVGKVDIVKLVLKNGADKSINIQSGNDGPRIKIGKQTALMMAIENGFIDIAKCLLEAGADCSIEDSKGSTAWDYACFAPVRKRKEFQKLLKPFCRPDPE